MPTVHGYVRVSHKNSAASGVSIASQKQAVQRKFDRIIDFDPRIKEGSIYEDIVVSAWRNPLHCRPGGLKLLQAIRPGDHVVFPNMKRAFRSVLDFEKQMKFWNEQNVKVHFCDINVNTDTAVGRMMLQIASVYAELESSIKSERIRAGLESKRLRGEGVSRPRIRRRTYEDLPPVPDSLVETRPAGKMYRYLRVSHIDSSESGLGMEWQQRVSANYVDDVLHTEEYQLVSAVDEPFVDDAVSAYSKRFRQRPAGRQLDKLLQPGDHVVFARMDRAFRSMSDFVRTWEDWKERGISMHLVDQDVDLSSSYGRLWAGIMALFSEWESETTSERTKASVRMLQNANKYFGGMPKKNTKGENQPFRIAKRYVKSSSREIWVPDRTAEAIIRYVAFLRNVKGWSYLEISDRVEALLAKREGRKPIPVSGKFKRGYKGDKFAKLIHREWSRRRVQYTLENIGKMLPRRYSSNSAFKA